MAPYTSAVAHTNVIPHHTSVQSQPAGQGVQTPVTTLTLSTRRHKTFLQTVSLHQNRLRIQDPGLYFIYSQMTFIYPRRTHKHRKTQDHYVYKHNDVLPIDGNELLLKASKTVGHTGQGHFTEDTSFTAGIFRLRAQDEVFVNVSDVTSVSDTPGTSFLGLYKIGLYVE